MKKLRQTLLMAAGVVLLAGLTSARADTVTIKASPYPGGLGGGEFTAVSSSLSTAQYSPLAIVNGGFETFCLEYNEHIQPGTTYNYTQGSTATAGDVVSGSDPLSVGTSWLYHQFANGTLTGYDYTDTAGRKISAGQLQLAFWYLEDETQFISGYTSWNGSGNTFLSQVGSQFGGLSNAKADASAGYLGVYTLNLTNLTSQTNAQSQLYYVPDNGPTLALLGIALLGLALYRRKVAA